jgi:hypothetical protein
MQKPSSQHHTFSEVASRILVATAAAILFSSPLVMLLVARGSYLPFSTETLTFRYFACVRILAGEGGTTWLGQGQLLTLCQNGILAAIHLFSRCGLEQELQLFSLGTSLLVGALMLTVYLIACFDRSLTRLDQALILILGPATVFGTVHAGFYYSLLPDYYALDLPIITASVYLAIRCLRSARPYSLHAVCLAGAFCGAAAANKITMLGPTGLLTLLVITRFPLNFLAFCLRLLAALAACVATTCLIFAATYLFSIAIASKAVREALAFAQGAGPEPNFWPTNFHLFLHSYGYDWVIAVWAAASVFCLVELARQKRWSQTALAFLANLLVAGLLMVGLFRRGAGTTFFEASSILAGLAVIMLAAALGPLARRRWAWSIPLALAVGSGAKFDFAHNWFVVTKSRQISENAWAARRYSLALGQPIIVIIPDQSYSTGTVEQLLQTTFFASGFGPASKALVDRFIPNTTFRTRPGSVRTGTTLVWFEKWDQAANRPLADTNPEEANRWIALRKLAVVNPSRIWRTGYYDSGVIHVMSVQHLN